MAADDLQLIADYLDEFLDVQQNLLDVMSAKLEKMTAFDLAEAAALETQERELIGRLERCAERRRELLDDAALNADKRPTLRAVVQARHPAERGMGDIDERFSVAEKQSHDLRMKSVTAWVLTQRSVVHWSQMLEIVAAQGRTVPTYSRDRKLRSRGALIDRAA